MGEEEEEGEQGEEEEGRRKRVGSGDLSKRRGGLCQTHGPGRWELAGVWVGTLAGLVPTGLTGTLFKEPLRSLQL